MQRLPLLLSALTLALPGAVVSAATPQAVDQRPEVRAVAGERAGAQASSDAEDRESLTVTVYQQGQALIRDQRHVGLTEGRSALSLLDVSPGLRPETLMLRGETDLRLHAQRWEQALLNRQALLEAHLGRVVELRRDDGAGGEAVARGVLRSALNGEAVVELEDGVEVVAPGSAWRIRFPALPTGLRAEPGLVLDLESASPGRQLVELLYLTDGLGWRADYVLDLRDAYLELTAWATLENSTGMDFGQATVRLVAGEPSRRGDVPMARALMTEADGLRARPEADYRLYTLPEPVEISAAQRSQFPLFRASRVPIEREYRVHGVAWGPAPGVQNPPVTVHLRFRNQGEALDRPLPAGTARVYQRDAGGEPLFLGEDGLPASAPGSEVELTVGTAFDVTAQRAQTAYRRLGERAEEQAWQVVLRNTLERPAVVRVTEQVPGDWSLLKSSHDPQQPSGAQGLEWQLEVPAGESVELTYRVEIRR
ncbi:MAG: DUF4139 domain-containing protein [Ectothiorhodospiraceae bacterium]|nr:DUF4139 domain-containing protein [Ectothiorhodospiraceae bacterium]